MPETDIKIKWAPDIPKIIDSQWARKYEECRKYRMIQGLFRYGWMSDNRGKFDNVNGAIERLQAYQRDGNMEHLADAGNLAMIEFMFGTHPKRHMAVRGGNIHVKRKGEYNEKCI